MITATRIVVAGALFFVAYYGYYTARHAYRSAARPYMAFLSVTLAAMGVFYVWFLVFDRPRSDAVATLFNAGWTAVLFAMWWGFRYMRRTLDARGRGE